MKKCVITELHRQIVSVLFQDGKETAIDVLQDGQDSLLDHIYVGRVRDVALSIQAAFIDIQPETTCFFSLEEEKHPIFLNPKKNGRVCQGDLILVQVKKDAVKTKAPTVSSVLELAGDYVALTADLPFDVRVSRKIKDRSTAERLRDLILPIAGASYGFIVRTDAQNAEDADVVAEAKKLAGQMDAILKYAPTRNAFCCMSRGESEFSKTLRAYKLGAEDELVTDMPEIAKTAEEINGAFAVRLYRDDLLPLAKLYRFEQILRNASEKKVWLKSGGYIIVEPTETLTVIDVNSGKYASAKRDKEAEVLKINLEAAEEIARQLRLRNLSGMILADFINMKQKESHVLLKRALTEHFSKDPVQTFLIDVTGLGLYEITRKKIKKSLREKIGEIHEQS